MKKDFIYFFRQVDLLRFNYLSPLYFISPTTLLLYTEWQIKYKLYKILSYFLLFLVLFLSLFLSACNSQHFFHQQCKTMMNLILIVQTQSFFGIGNFTTLMRCSVNKNRRQSVKRYS